MIASALLALASAGTGLEPVEYERRAVEHRQRIKALHYAATVTNVVPAYDGQPESRQAERHEVWSDGERYRCDRTPVNGWPSSVQSVVRLGGGTSPISLAGTRSTVCRGCRADGAYLRFIHPGTPVTFYRPTAAERSDFEKERLDPSGLGFGHSGGLRPPRLPGKLVDPGVRYTSAEPTTVAGKPAVLVRGTYVRSGSEHRCWVDPDRGYNVVRFELASPPAKPGGPERLGVVIETELSQDMPSGIWFPKSYWGRHFYPDGSVNETRVAVEVAAFNRPPDPAAFTLAGLGLSRGTVVKDEGANDGGQFWTGQELSNRPTGVMPPEVRALAAALPPSAVPAETPPAGSVPVPDPTRTPGWVYAAAAALAAVGCGLFALAYRPRR
jgi:hypothetical protein